MIVVGDRVFFLNIVLDWDCTEFWTDLKYVDFGRIAFVYKDARCCSDANVLDGFDFSPLIDSREENALVSIILLAYEFTYILDVFFTHVLLNYVPVYFFRFEHA